MPWAEIHWRSRLLGKQTVTQVLLPSGGKPPFATCYLLHGIFGDSTDWLRHSRLEWHVRDLPLIVVLPDGYRGFYTDNEAGPAYAQHFGEELPDFIERNFPARPARGARAVGGVSMGGYGALRVGLGYPDRFCSVNSHSGAVMRFHRDLTLRDARREPVFRRHPAPFFRELKRVFGPHPGRTCHDLLALVRRARRLHLRLPKILIDCGTDDPLLDANRTLDRDLTAAKVPHAYREFPGGHDWDYWDDHICDAFAFHARNLRLC